MIGVSSNSQVVVLAVLAMLMVCCSAFRASTSKSRLTKGLCTSMSKVSDVVDVDLGDRSYPIYIGQGMVDGGDELRKHVTSKKAMIVTNTKIGPLYSAKVRAALEQQGTEVYEVVLPDGEEYKNMDELMKVLNACMEARLDRKSTLIALGGGVIGDMTGFAAAIYQRGIKFVQVPTSLMAMVDSSVGGKTAVNHPSGKNMIGAFYQPEAVIIDTTTLDTLPPREYLSGISEVIKYGLIRDAPFFEWLEANMDELVARVPSIVAESVRRSCENKAEVVALDENEGGVRATLNLGHTFGHAIENGMGYGAWLHGEAVGTGMLMAADMSCQMGLIKEGLKQRISAILQKAKLPDTLSNTHAETGLGQDEYGKRLTSLTSEKFLELMAMDKKVADGQLSLVLLEGELGNSIITNQFQHDQLERVVIEWGAR